MVMAVLLLDYYDGGRHRHHAAFSLVADGAARRVDSAFGA